MIKDRLTIITATTPEISLNAPEISIIRKTIKTFYKYLNIGVCRHIICMDDTLNNEISDEYFNNLKQLENEYQNIEVYRRNYKHLGNITLDMVDMTTTPYVFVLEHDWEIRTYIPTEKILDVFDKYSYVNYIRLPKLPLISPVIDEKGVTRNYRFEVEDKITDLPLLREWTYSGNPHFERVSFLKEFCKPIIKNSDRMGRKSYESPVWTQYRELYKNNPSFFMGIYVLGKLGDSPVLKHIPRGK